MFRGIVNQVNSCATCVPYSFIPPEACFPWTMHGINHCKRYSRGFSKCYLIESL